MRLVNCQAASTKSWTQAAPATKNRLLSQQQLLTDWLTLSLNLSLSLLSFSVSSPFSLLSSLSLHLPFCLLSVGQNNWKLGNVLRTSSNKFVSRWTDLIVATGDVTLWHVACEFWVVVAGRLKTGCNNSKNKKLALPFASGLPC